MLTAVDNGRLAVVATEVWPRAAGEAVPPLPGFVPSPFSPLVAELAERCLRRRYGAPPVRDADGTGIGIVLVTAYGDVTGAEQVTDAVRTGKPLDPLFYFQAIPNAVLGHVAARWLLGGPLVCLRPLGDPIGEGLAEAELLLADGDARQVLLLHADEPFVDGRPGAAAALLVCAAAEAGEASGPSPSREALGR